jgi:hypothetical protein
MRIARKTQALALSMMLGLPVLGGCVGGEVDTGDPATENALSPKTQYLALGDSVAFGYNPVDAVNHPKEIKFFTGYPEIIKSTVIPASANASCEGETSGSFLDVTSPDNGCHQWRADGNAMHVAYDSNAQSQMAFALNYVRKGGITKVSLGIGANDLLLLQTSCAIQTQSTSSAAFFGCVQQGLPAAIGGAVNNVVTIVSQLRGSGYAGQIELVTYYTPLYNPADPNFQAIYALDRELVRAAQGMSQAGLAVDVAQGFSAFGAIAAAKGGDACAAGLLYRLNATTCDKHPSAFGQSVLAGAVGAAVSAISIGNVDDTANAHF